MHERLSRWWSSISLRTKVTGVTVLLVTFGLLVVGTGTISVLRAYLVDEVDKKLSASLEQFQPIFTVTDSGLECSTTAGLREEYYTAIVTPDGNMLCDNRADDATVPDVSPVDLGLANAQAGRAFTLSDEDRTGQWRAVALVLSPDDSPDYYTFVVGMNLAETNRIIAQFTAIFFFFGVNVVILGAAITRLLVTSTFAPLREVEATAAQFADGDFTQRLTGATTPNTEVGRLNRSLNTMLARIDNAFKDRARTIDQMRRFVGDASHELRTPLVSVRGYAELYRMGALQKPEDVAQAMERIEKEALRMGELVEDLLALARLDEAKPLQLAPIDLMPIAHDAALDAMASSPQRTVSVVVADPIPARPDEVSDEQADVAASAQTAPPTARRLARAEATWARLRNRAGKPAKTPVITEAEQPIEVQTPAVVLGEENKIRQVITNLMGNAMRFTAPDSPIEIGVQVDRRNGVGIISVIDHGEGIPPQIREKIFQRFWRADSSRARDTGGSGLGLAIVSAIVANHHGSVDVVETPGGGATFRVSLPLAPVPVPAAAPAPAAE
ncbi:ATP-binding protein [Diaminobutyricimonas sp. TR449]|uniref:sensor histidine kinase n=1 Tax=Diaminobutyricimonas sp. TR449 TaxID=2708076 RepID=UPI00142459D6|nr:ATP-binding protein [Diaminobutyricimonas sp. TR449]